MINAVLDTKSGDNSPALQALIDAVPKYGRATIQLPDGDYWFKSTISIVDRGINIKGSDNTTLHFYAGTSGFVIDTYGWFPGSFRMSDISIISNGQRQGTTSIGVQTSVITQMENVSITNFGSYGLCITADINTHHQNASHSTFRRVAVSQCGAGVYMHGGDANAMGFYDLDVRDCDGVGIDDCSFLGNTFINPMVHNCKGAYKSNYSANNRTTFIGPYAEGGQGDSLIGGVTVVIGGINGPGTQWKALTAHCKIIAGDVLLNDIMK